MPCSASIHFAAAGVERVDARSADVDRKHAEPLHRVDAEQRARRRAPPRRALRDRAGSRRRTRPTKRDETRVRRELLAQHVGASAGSPPSGQVARRRRGAASASHGIAFAGNSLSQSSTSSPGRQSRPAATALRPRARCSSAARFRRPGRADEAADPFAVLGQRRSYGYVPSTPSAACSRTNVSIAATLDAATRPPTRG